MKKIMSRKDIFAIFPLCLLLAACSKNNMELLPDNSSKAPTNIVATNALYTEFLGTGYSEGRVQLHNISFGIHGALWVYFDYQVQADVVRVKQNGVAQLDINNLSVWGGVSSYTGGSGDSSYIYDITASIRSLTVQKAYTVGLNYKGNVTGDLTITKRSKFPWSTGSETMSSVQFSKEFSGVVVLPPSE